MLILRTNERNQGAASRVSELQRRILHLAVSFADDPARGSSIVVQMPIVVAGAHTYRPETLPRYKCDVTITEALHYVGGLPICGRASKDENGRIARFGLRGPGKAIDAARAGCGYHKVRQAIYRSVRRLAARGLIERVLDRDGGYNLTPAGRHLAVYSPSPQSERKPLP